LISLFYSHFGSFIQACSDWTSFCGACATRSDAAEPYVTEAYTIESPTTEGESSNTPIERIVAQALNKMTKLLPQMSKGNRWEERKPELLEDYALERFLRLHPPIYQGKGDSEREFDL
jgi:hypothetical protein